MEITNNYQFFFVGGSCGSFVKGIFYYYLYKLKQYNIPINFKINPVTGDCHNNAIPRHYHYLTEIDYDKKIIVIDFDDDDKSTIIKMVFHKYFKFEICKNPEILKENWLGELSNIDPMDIDLLEKTFVQNPNYLISPTWQIQLEKITPGLTIKFKDILYGNLNEIIANFLQVSQLPEVDRYIDEYRAINKKYIDIAQ